MKITPLISVICPVYNEERYIESILNFFALAPPERKELFVIDGGSTDNTKIIYHQWKLQNPAVNVEWLENPNKYVSYALNKAIPMCNGDIIVRLDAHTTYSSDYFTKILDTFESTGADIVGGPMRAKGDTPFQLAVSYATSTIFGIGDSSFHDENHQGFVDSVYLGAWKTSIFKEIGMFDVELVRNQDDEFHYRANEKGKSIYLNPAIRSYYYPRANLKSLFSQYFQYGYYKPLVLKKVRSGIRIRHIIPSFFLLYITATGLLCLSGFYHTLIVAPLLLYTTLNFLFSFANRLPLQSRFLNIVVYPTLHLAYGAGFIAGIINTPTNEQPRLRNSH
jgi:glycosyltransferase involved in cell wall biosynthesis